MKIITKKILMAVALLSLSACGTVPGLADLGAYKTGIQISPDQMARLTDKKSTQEDVIAVVGESNRKAQVGQKEIWYYDFNQVGQPYIGKSFNETTAFEFNQKGILQAHYKTGNNGTSSNPLT